ncbi:hypothetical protein ABZ234_08005 [Nocardiopsis sp. NPDC006198]|uniref:hypothetical protein n=1 Tax=Nocardiopsis sp. NPDC006198 TaxID=3154472 RepID=UPI0033A4190C
MSPVLTRAATTLHVLEALNGKPAAEFLPDFVATLAARAEATTGVPREHIADEAEFIAATDHWEEPIGHAAIDARQAIESCPLDPSEVLRGLQLVNRDPSLPGCLSGLAASGAQAPSDEKETVELMEDYAAILAGALHLTRSIWA